MATALELNLVRGELDAADAQEVKAYVQVVRTAVTAIILLDKHIVSQYMGQEDIRLVASFARGPKYCPAMFNLNVDSSSMNAYCYHRVPWDEKCCKRLTT